MTTKRAPFFHPEAAASFNQRAEFLLTALRPVLRDSPRPPRFEPDTTPRQVINLEEIKDVIRMRDLTPLEYRPTSIKFGIHPNFVGLFGDHCQEFILLASAVQSTGGVRGLASLKFVEGCLEDWLYARHARESTEGFTMDLERRLEAAIRQQTVLLPIHNLYVEEAFGIGEVQLAPLGSDFFEKLEADRRKHLRSEEEDAFAQYMKESRDELQGLAAGAITMECEDGLAQERAVATIEQAIAVLRVVHPVNSSPYAYLSCRPFATSPLSGFRAFHEVGEDINEHSWLVSPPPEDWKISAEESREEIFGVLNDFMGAANPTEFQSLLREVLSLYSRGNLSRDPNIKLLFIMVALEHLLLPGSSDPVGHVLAESIALLNGRSFAESKAIERLVKEVYGFRSRFIHHGKEVAELKRLGEFMHIAWVLMLWLILRHKYFLTKEALLAHVEQLRYGRR
jgi:hypothetical protein